MKALSVKQPWAMALVDGAKTIEVRTWSTRHRGPLVICASASPKNWFMRDEVTNELLLIPSGCIMGIVDVIDCRPMTKADEAGAFCESFPGAWAWVVEPIAHCRPDKILGKLNLFEVAVAHLVRLDDERDSIFNYNSPQGEVKYTERCPVLE
jgi:hypothetical protein